MTHAAQEITRSRRPAVPAGDPILASKITAPGVPDWAVQRPRITKLIAEGVRWCPLTVVTGPPGAGKTMAVALWAAAGPGRIAWVGLDEYDNRPGALWSYILAALIRCGVAVPRALPAVIRGRAADHGFLLQLAAALAAQHPPVTLVLDDLHLLTGPEELAGLDYLLRNVGPGLRLVICSRMDPLLPLHRYRLAGQLAEIRAADLAFSTAEAGLLLAQHGCTLPEDGLESLTRRTEGWAAGLRLVALSMGAQPDPGQFVKDMIAEDSPVTGYLVQEVLSTQPPEVRDMLLCTAVLDQVSAEAAAELAGDERAAGTFSALTRANAFIQPIGSGWYRYHTVLAEVLRLKLRSEHPDRVAVLHRRAARWYGRTGRLTDAVRHAARAGDWPLAACRVVDDLAIGHILQPRGCRALADEFAAMPGQAWAEPQPHLVLAAAELSDGRPASCMAALDVADGMLERVPAGQQATARLTAAVIRLAASLRTGDLATAAAAAARAQALGSQVPEDKLAQHPGIRARVLSGRGAVELWSGHFDEAAHILQAGLATRAASATEGEPPDCLGHLALAEALRGRLHRAVKLATQATEATTGAPQPPVQDPDAAALVALAWVHLERNELGEAGRRLKQADVVLGTRPDKLIGTVAYLVAATAALTEGRAAVVSQLITRARSGCYVPAWLDHKLSLVHSRACAAAGDVTAAIAAAEHAGAGASPEAAVTLAHTWMTAANGDNARRALAPALTAGSKEPERVRVQALLADARLSYAGGDRIRGRRSFAAALRLAEPEQLRLPFVLERSWIGQVLRREPELVSTHRGLLGPALHRGQLPAPRAAPDQAARVMVEPLSEREQEVLRHVSSMLTTAQIANEMYLSANTVKTHLRNIYRKLAATRRGEAVRRARELRLI